MNRFVLIILFALATVVWAQDDAADDAESESSPEAAEDVSAAEIDDFELSDTEDHTEEDEDVFKPTDVVSFQQSVPFPVDI